MGIRKKDYSKLGILAAAFFGTSETFEPADDFEDLRPGKRFARGTGHVFLPTRSQKIKTKRLRALRVKG